MIPMNDSNTLSFLSVIQAAHNSDIKKEAPSPKHSRPPDVSVGPSALSFDAASSASTPASTQSQQVPVSVFTIYNPTPNESEEPSAKRQREDEEWNHWDTASMFYLWFLLNVRQVVFVATNISQLTFKKLFYRWLVKVPSLQIILFTNVNVLLKHRRQTVVITRMLTWICNLTI